jgi:hypothetical protein
MLQLTIPAVELFDEFTQTFINTKATVLTMEHSLVSLSKWESKWCKPFLEKVEKTDAETLDYISSMTITQNVDPSVFIYLPNDTIDQVQNYIGLPMTATVISKNHMRNSSREVITAEIIYYWMVSLNIPFECQKWHLNRLLTLINVCNIKNGPQKKMGQREIMRRNTDLNAQRRAALESKG